MIAKTARWELNGVRIVGPDSVSYAEVQSSPRMDGVPLRQGGIGMEWRYQHLPIEELTILMNLWNEGAPAILVQWLDPQETWQIAEWSMLQPQIGRRSAFYATDIAIRFVTVAYSGAGLTISAGETPELYDGFNIPNPPPVAVISYSAAIVGDPEVIVNLNGGGSHDPDGIITSYAWADNSDAFQSLPDYPQFDPPHAGNGVTATFIYTYATGMPNPVITLTVADNAGQTGVASVEVNIADLVADLPTKGIRMLCAVGGVGYVSYDGGLEFKVIADVTGVTCVAGAGGYIVLGCDDGTLYITANDSITGARAVFTMGAPVRYLSVAAQSASYVAAVDTSGAVAVSSSSGQFFTAIGGIGGGLHISWNQQVANELGVSGGTVAYTRNNGTTWEQDTAGLPGGSWASTRRASVLRYTGGNAGLYVASGLAWNAISGVSNVTALSQIGGGDGNRIIVGCNDGTLVRVVETTVQQTQQAGGRVNDLARQPAAGSSLLLIGTDAGLYKTLDDLESIGLMMFPGLSVTSVDFMRDGGSGLGSLLLPVSGDLDTTGIWHHISGQGWTRKNGSGEFGLRVGYDWHQVVADPYDVSKWAALCNTVGNGRTYDYNPASGEVVCKGMLAAPVSPLWVTTNAGLSWEPVILRTQSHIGHNTDASGGTNQWASFVIEDLEFDRVATRKLFVFGHGTVAADSGGDTRAPHGMVWHGQTPTLEAKLLLDASAVGSNQGSFGRYSNEVASFRSAEGGPDGGIVGYSCSPGGFFDTEIVLRVVYTDSAIAKTFKNPGGTEPLSGRTKPMYAAMERRPSFSSLSIVGVYYEDGVDGEGLVHVCGVENYKTQPMVRKFDVLGRRFTLPVPPAIAALQTNNLWTSKMARMTYAASGIYVGGGMGVVNVVDPFVSSTQDTYEPTKYFTAVRCDRQWRAVVAAMEYFAGRIHVKTVNGWGQITLPSGVAYHTGDGMEVLGL